MGEVPLILAIQTTRWDLRSTFMTRQPAAIVTVYPPVQVVVSGIGSLQTLRDLDSHNTRQSGGTGRLMENSMQYERSFPLKTILIVTVIAGLCIYGIVFVFHMQSTRPNHQGTSTFAPLDIVSGEISAATQQQILDTLAFYTGEPLDWKDLSLQSGSYKKDLTEYSISIRASFDIPKLKTAYDISLQGNDPSSLKLAVYCAVHLPPGYSCLFSSAVSTGD